MSTPQISIVMGYYNRKPQCLETLKSIQRSAAATKVEVIIVDDGSNPDHDLSEALKTVDVSFPIRLIPIPKALKTWTSPIVGYNIGLEHATGEWTIIQNPEVCHVNDICDFVSKQTDTKTYHAFHVFACKDQTFNPRVIELLPRPSHLVGLLEKQIKGNWYCHPKKRPKAYHFCAAIHRSRLDAVGGFNPIMKNGIDYDDDEILARISRVCTVKFQPLIGIHLWHPRFSYQLPGYKALQAKNKKLHQATLTNKKLIKVERFDNDMRVLFSKLKELRFEPGGISKVIKEPTVEESPKVKSPEVVEEPPKVEPPKVVEEERPKVVEAEPPKVEPPKVEPPKVVEEEPPKVPPKVEEPLKVVEAALKEVESKAPVKQTRHTVVTITGIRPDFIRMSQVFKKLDEDPNIKHVMIHTGQHYDTYLSESFFRDLKLRAPDYQLSTGTSSKNHYEQLSYLSLAVIECLKTNNIESDLILFLGDSNTSAVALPLKKEGYIIGHIESGMRSYDRRMLEEINRTVCDICSDVFFVYHAENRTNLLKENIDRPIYVVGNTVVEPCKIFIDKMHLKLRDTHKSRNCIIMDVHRPENFNHVHRLRNVFAFANALGAYYKLPVKCLYFKRLKDQIDKHNLDLGSVKLIDLMSYPDYLREIYHCEVLLSDSGTGQEEPALLKTPVIVPRDFTERPQSYAANCSIQLPVENDCTGELEKVVEWVKNYHSGSMTVDISWLGDGSTSDLIMSGIHEFLEKK